MSEPKLPKVTVYLESLVVGFMIYFLQDQEGVLARTTKDLASQQREFRNAVRSGNVGNLLAAKRREKMSEKEQLVRIGLATGFNFCIYEIVQQEIFNVATYEQYREFQDEAKLGDIDYLLNICRKWVHVE